MLINHATIGFSSMFKKHTDIHMCNTQKTKWLKLALDWTQELNPQNTLETNFLKIRLQITFKRYNAKNRLYSQFYSLYLEKHVLQMIYLLYVYPYIYKSKPFKTGCPGFSHQTAGPQLWVFHVCSSTSAKHPSRNRRNGERHRWRIQLLMASRITLWIQVVSLLGMHFGYNLGGKFMYLLRRYLDP